MVDIFITDIKTEYTTLEQYKDNECIEHNEVDGYKVGFVLNKCIACEIRVSAKHCSGCKEQIRDYIRDTIMGGVK